MSDIQRYWINPDGITPETVPNGQWVRFVDHIADRKADRERIAELEAKEKYAIAAHDKEFRLRSIAEERIAALEGGEGEYRHLILIVSGFLAGNNSQEDLIACMENIVSGV